MITVTFPVLTTDDSQASAADIDIIYDVCWMLSPMQIQRLCTNYYVADYEVSRILHKEVTEG
jgi:hypothetical protein